ncbi:Flp family type IVb pilin [Halomonas organivorans]
MKTFSFHRALGKTHAEPTNARLNRPAFRRQRGATAVEYAIIAAVVAVAIFAIFGADDGGFTTLLENLFDKVETEVSGS